MNTRTLFNIFLCATFGAILYYAYGQIHHYMQHQVFPGDIWFLVLMLLFAYIVAGLICVPLIWVMRHFNIYNFTSVLFLSTIVVGIVISVSNNGILWQHPEGYVIGFISGCLFILLERRKASNKALNSQPPAAGTPKSGAH